MSQIRVGELAFEYDEFGKTSDPALILIMGLSAQMIFFDEDFCQGLANEGFRVIRFDNRDVGLSSKLDEYTAPNPIVQETLKRFIGYTVKTPYTLSDMANDVIGIMDGLGIEKAHVAGVSMGGIICQLLGILHPERIRSLTAMLTTSLNPKVCRPERGVLARLSRALRNPSTERKAAIREKKAFFKLLAGKTYPSDQKFIKLIELAYDRCNCPEGAKRQLAAILAESSLSERLRNMFLPLLVIAGTEDPLAPLAGAQDIADNAPNSKMVVIEGLGHCIPRQLYQDFIQLITSHAQAAVA